MNKGTKLASDIKYYSSYSKYLEWEGRKETWKESIERVMGMHKTKFQHIYDTNKRFKELVDFAQEQYEKRYVLASQRSLQWAADPIFKHNARMFNCLTLYADRAAFFQETMYWLLAGCGVGFSVQKKHTDSMPWLQRRNRGVKTFVIDDSIEGWSDSIGVLISSYMVGGSSFPEYEGYRVDFDYSQIRKKGSKISGGFKAPGSDGLREAHNKIQTMLGNYINGSTEPKPFKSILIYDTVMHSSDAVLSGGVRRSATICLFSIDDEDMLKAKTGDWFVANPQRGRSNNSVVLLRDKTTREEFARIMESVKGFGEPGFVWSDDEDILYNPCLTGDCIVETNNGDYTMEELAGLDVSELNNIKAITFNETTHKTEYKTIEKAFLTKKNADIVKITFNDNTTIRCTPDHKIYTMNRGWQYAKDLSDQDMIVARSGENGYMNSILHRREVPVDTDGNKVKSIKTIEVDGSEDVYDLTISDNHNFYANGTLVHNCVEIGMVPKYKVETEEEADQYGVNVGDWISGAQGCNLTEINGGAMETEEMLLDACIASAVIGTLQASYTDFKYVGEISKKIFDKEALLGCSITGWMSNPDLLFDEERLKRAVNVIKEINEEVAEIIGINPAARLTCTKPSGNACQTFDGVIKTTNGDMTLAEIFNYCANDDEFVKKISDDKAYAVKNPLMVYDENGELQPITALYSNGIQEVYEVEFEDGNVYKFTGEHKLKTETGWKCVSALDEDVVIRKNTMGIKIKRIKKIDEHRTGDIQVANTHSYLLKNGVVSHNSVLLGTASGIHGEHAPRYFRNIQMNKTEDLAIHFHEINPDAIEESVWSANKSDWVVSIPIEANPGSKFKNQLYGVKQLEYVKKAQMWWAEPGTVLERCTLPTVRHNISNTIQVDDWDDVEQYIWDNREYFAGISLLSATGDRDYAQAPFTSVYTAKQILRMYGDAALYASGLIVDGLDVFENDLWAACSTVLGHGMKLTHTKEEVHAEIEKTDIETLWSNLGMKGRILKALIKSDEKPDVVDYKEYMDRRLVTNVFKATEKTDWVRRANQFSDRFFKGDVKKMTYCLKDVYNNHKWNKIQRNMVDIDWTEVDMKPDYIDVGTMGAVACNGNTCEVPD